MSPSQCIPVEARFWSKVEITPGCWLWTGCKGGNGYPHFRMNGRQMLAHRVAFEWARGTIPEGAHLDHLCRPRACVNPAHLEPVSCRDNILRGVGAAAINSHKTHCPKGHPFTEGNLVPSILRRTGDRCCLTCYRAYHRRWERAHYKKAANA